MTFGLCPVAQTYQRFMDQLFQDILYVFVYLDDILVASNNHIAYIFVLLKKIYKTVYKKNYVM